MYNKYIPSDAAAFSELYRAVEYDHAPECEKNFGESYEYPAERKTKKERFDLKRLLHGLDIDKMGIIPIVLLLLLLLDVDDEERIIIIALAVLFGI